MPRADSAAQFERAIFGLCDQHDVKIVFATTDHDALAVATLAPELRARGIVAAVADAALLRAWADKVVCLRDVAAAGLPVLPIIDPEQGGCTYPLIGKPRHGRGGRGHVIVRSSAETAAASRSDPDHRLFWQPLLDSFDEWSVDFAVRESGESRRWWSASGYVHPGDSRWSAASARHTRCSGRCARGAGSSLDAADADW